MSLSSTAVIHLTNSIGNVFSILEEGFKPTYCYEKVIETLTPDKEYLHAAFPMVSFSDIPLSELKNHLDSYGNYGLGLTKEWAKKNSLNPVLYFEKDSLLMANFIGGFESLKKGIGTLGFNDDFLHLFMSLLSFSKNYEGDLKTKSRRVKNYRFSDEREWRWVPDMFELKLGSDFESDQFIARLTGKIDGPPPYISEKDYKENKLHWNSMLNHLRLKFKPTDIRYIIIKSESELDLAINKIDTYAGRKFPDLAKTLVSRIVTSDQIRFDL